MAKTAISVKASGDGHASHYYSMTRLETTGEFFADGKSQSFRGESWFDHEWATNQLAPGQVGWDWLSVQFDDGTELMLYQMRLENGAADPASSGTLDRSRRHEHSSAERQLSDDADRILEERQERRASIRSAGESICRNSDVQFTVRAAVENQELSLAAARLLGRRDRGDRDA